MPEDKPEVSGMCSMPLVSVCIGTYNQAQYLTECIESVLAQSYPIEEIWVSDDASTDGTEDVMREICAKHPRIHYHRQPVNLGLSGNLSWVLSQPKTDLVVRLDSDDRLETEYVEVLAGLMKKHPSAGFAHCDVYEMNGGGRRTRERRLNRRSEFETGEEFLRANASGFRVAANCLLYRSSALASANYFFPTPRWSAGEDWHLCLRISAGGWGNVYAGRLLTNYRQWDDILNTRAARKLEEISNVTDIYRKILEPEYKKRGWDTSILQRNMRRRAVGFASALDSPLWSQQERDKCKMLLRQQGDSYSLSITIFLADAGFNPIIRQMSRVRIWLKDLLKRGMRWAASARRSPRRSVTGQAPEAEAHGPMERS